jgi:integrase
MIVTEIISIQDLMLSSVQEATKIVDELTSKNSRDAYYGDLYYLKNWFEAIGLSFDDPIEKQHVITFIMHHVQGMPENIERYLVEKGVKKKYGNHKIGTVERRLKTLSKYLQSKNLDNPCQGRDIIMLFRKLKEIYGGSQPKGKAMTLDLLNQLLETCVDDGLIGIRDTALLLFGFASGGRRCSEITSAKVEQLRRNPDGTYLINLGKSKTNQTGKEDLKPILGRAAIALTHWLNVSKIDSGSIFRGIIQNKCILEHGMLPQQVRRIVKGRCIKAGLDYNKYTAHSLRSGFVTEAGRRGKPIGDIMALTGHKTIKQLMEYYQCGAILNNSAAYLAG